MKRRCGFVFLCFVSVLFQRTAASQEEFAVKTTWIRNNEQRFLQSADVGPIPRRRFCTTEQAADAILGLRGPSSTQQVKREIQRELPCFCADQSYMTFIAETSWTVPSLLDYTYIFGIQTGESFEATAVRQTFASNLDEVVSQIDLLSNLSANGITLDYQDNGSLIYEQNALLPAQASQVVPDQAQVAYGVVHPRSYMFTFYRKDLINFTLQTWDDVLYALNILNGTDMNEDGFPDWALCVDALPPCKGHALLMSMAASIMQTQGSTQGLYLDRMTLAPLTNTSGMKRALELYQMVMAYNSPNSTQQCTGVSSDFLAGRCAVTFNYDFNYKYYNGSSTYPIWMPLLLNDTVSVDIMPGSTEVWDPSTDTIMPCTYPSSICPYGELAINNISQYQNSGSSGGSSGPPGLGSSGSSGGSSGPPGLGSSSSSGPPGSGVNSISSSTSSSLPNGGRFLLGNSDAKSRSLLFDVFVNRPTFSSFALTTESLALQSPTTPAEANAAVVFSAFFDQELLTYLKARQMAIQPSLAALDQGTTMTRAQTLLDLSFFQEWSYSRAFSMEYLGAYLRAFYETRPNLTSNYAMDLGVQNAEFYRLAVEEAAYNVTVSGTSVESAMTALTGSFLALNEFTSAAFGNGPSGASGLPSLLTQYWQTLGYAPPPPVPTPPPPPAPPAVVAPSSSSVGNLKGFLLAIVLPLMAVLILLIPLLWYILWHRHLSLTGAVIAPLPGPHSTLVHALVPDFKELQKELPASVVSRAITVYKETMRKLLRVHKGFELSAREKEPEIYQYEEESSSVESTGIQAQSPDFVAAFHTAQDAAAYCTACQLELLNHILWPADLLNHPKGCETWVEEVSGLSSSAMPNDQEDQETNGALRPLNPKPLDPKTLNSSTTPTLITPQSREAAITLFSEVSYTQSLMAQPSNVGSCIRSGQVLATAENGREVHHVGVRVGGGREPPLPVFEEEDNTGLQQEEGGILHMDPFTHAYGRLLSRRSPMHLHEGETRELRSCKSLSNFQQGTMLERLRSSLRSPRSLRPPNKRTAHDPAVAIQNVEESYNSAQGCPDAGNELQEEALPAQVVKCLNSDKYVGAAEQLSTPSDVQDGGTRSEALQGLATSADCGKEGIRLGSLDQIHQDWGRVWMDFLRLKYRTAVGSPTKHSSASDTVATVLVRSRSLVKNGLGVSMGMLSGEGRSQHFKSDRVGLSFSAKWLGLYNKEAVTWIREQYGKPSFNSLRCVALAAYPGQVLMSGSTFRQLRLGAMKQPTLALHMGDYLLAGYTPASTKSLRRSDQSFQEAASFSNGSIKFPTSITVARPVQRSITSNLLSRSFSRLAGEGSITGGLLSLASMPSFRPAATNANVTAYDYNTRPLADLASSSRIFPAIIWEDASAADVQSWAPSPRQQGTTRSSTRSSTPPSEALKDSLDPVSPTSISSPLRPIPFSKFNSSRQGSQSPNVNWGRNPLISGIPRPFLNAPAYSVKGASAPSSPQHGLENPKLRKGKSTRFNPLPTPSAPTSPPLHSHTLEPSVRPAPTTSTSYSYSVPVLKGSRPLSMMQVLSNAVEGTKNLRAQTAGTSDGLDKAESACLGEPRVRVICAPIVADVEDSLVGEKQLKHTTLSATATALSSAPDRTTDELIFDGPLAVQHGGLVYCSSYAALDSRLAVECTTARSSAVLEHKSPRSHDTEQSYPVIAEGLSNAENFEASAANLIKTAPRDSSHVMCGAHGLRSVGNRSHDEQQQQEGADEPGSPGAAPVSFVLPKPLLLPKDHDAEAISTADSISAKCVGLFQLLDLSVACRLVTFNSPDEPSIKAGVQVTAGTLDAPVGVITAAYMYVPGAARLSTELPGISEQCLATFHKVSSRELSPYGGYLVQASGGLVLAVFPQPQGALKWCLSCQRAMGEQEWPPELLEHVLGEQVVVWIPEKGSLRMKQKVVSRGLRIKAGCDVGRVTAAVNPTTGRMDYRGRAMNKAARVASKALSGQILCSDTCWEAVQQLPALADNSECMQLTAISTGSHKLKGVEGTTEIYEITWQ
ncbi:hypothetical protein CEUSTIGMA_g202.t1 [Chlamydomonas eustigma]|uniref:Guanylate cyclase domain-containing protein n=1 Tax=Chlamydomonas eustigma TaxID=1157962 RepID=A0A250WPX1_9CHLO|nr:hypothetical protein CEUSTIGMA_g202.t1 [Chlamydomonas eustigma]|eukprot:GAX72746.1 hypothetical protein CEUSTIGMA_g202.t1 [Chlamydomonas eustigma]